MSWPHKMEIWSWGDQMDQVILLLRKPRQAIPSYHTMRYELNYCSTWLAREKMVPETYRKRPTVEKLVQWRDKLFNTEMDNWFNLYDFWMQDGFEEHNDQMHINCIDEKVNIECQPQTIIDFENMYSINLNDDFLKVGRVLDASKDVSVISEQARACVLNNVMSMTDHKDLNMHQVSQPYPDLPHEYLFNVSQFDRMFNQTIELRNSFLLSPSPSNLSQVI